MLTRSTWCRNISLIDRMRHLHRAMQRSVKLHPNLPFYATLLQVNDNVGSQDLLSEPDLCWALRVSCGARCQVLDLLVPLLRPALPDVFSLFAAILLMVHQRNRMVASTVSARPSFGCMNSRRSMAPELSMSKTHQTSRRLSLNCEMPATSMLKVFANARTTSWKLTRPSRRK